MNDELKDEGIRGKKMLTGKRLIFAIMGAILAGAVIAGIYYYENTYKFRQYSVDVNSDLGKTATKIALDTMIDEGYKPNELIPRVIKAQNIGFDYQGTQSPVYDIVRLWVLLSEPDTYENYTLFTNHPIKNGETSILLYNFVTPVEGSKETPWKPGTAEWPPRYYTITIKDSTIEASLDGVKRARIINPAIVDMSADENKKQIDLINEAGYRYGDIKYRYGGTNLTYDTNILVLYAYGTYNPWPRESVEVVIDIVGNNAKISGIIKYEGSFESKNEYRIDRNVEERKWYIKPKTVPIKPEN